jgi:hypothetical protein
MCAFVVVVVVVVVGVGVGGVGVGGVVGVVVIISGGTRQHLQVAHLLLMRGADPSPSYASKSTPFPAIYYALGAFTTPTNAQVRTLQEGFVSVNRVNF